MSTKVQCPNCLAESPIPEAFLGRNLRCKKCAREFLAVPKGAAAAPNDNSTDQAVVARRVDERSTARANVSPLWMAAAVAAFLVPVAAAATFATLEWNFGGSLKYGVIEITSDNVKYTYFELYPDATVEHNFRIQDENSTKTGLAKSMDRAGTFSARGLESAANAVVEFRNRLIEQDHLPPEKVFVIGSGGFAASIRKSTTIPDSEKPNVIQTLQSEMQRRLTGAIGADVEWLDIDKETKLQFDGVVRKRDRDQGNALLLKIGESGTRGGYVDSSRVLKSVELVGIDDFRRTVAKRHKEQGGVFADVAQQLAQAELNEKFRDVLNEDPRLQKLPQVYLTGGIVWVLAVHQHPEQREVYVEFTAADIDGFARAMRESLTPMQDFAAQIELDDRLTPEMRAEIKEELRKMSEKHLDEPDKLICGSLTLLALSRELRLDEKKVWFPRYGDQALAREYAASKYRSGK